MEATLCQCNTRSKQGGTGGSSWVNSPTTYLSETPKSDCRWTCGLPTYLLPHFVRCLNKLPTLPAYLTCLPYPPIVIVIDCVWLELAHVAQLNWLCYLADWFCSRFHGWNQPVQQVFHILSTFTLHYTTLPRYSWFFMFYVEDIVSSSFVHSG